MAPRIAAAAATLATVAALVYLVRRWRSADEPAGEAGGDAPGMGEAVRSSLLSRLSCQPRPICVVLWSVELERSAAWLMTEQIVLPNGSLMD